jgi:RNA polymerase sigma-70 factor (ECF subfamily)
MAESPNRSGPAAGKESLDLESSAVLLEHARAGNRDALERLLARYLPRLRRCAPGRLPPHARDLADTADLVQDTLLRAFPHIGTIELRGDGAVLAYLRQALLNRIRDELRRVERRPPHEDLDAPLPAATPSPLEQAIGGEALARYEQALGRLCPEDREAIVARLEMGCSYAEVAASLGKPTADAATKMVNRALVRLANEMNRP